MYKKLVLVLSISVSLNAQDLQTTIAELIQTNPIIQERLKNYKASKEKIRSVESAYYPSLDLTLGAGIENKTTLDTNPTVSKDLDVYQATLSYTQNIFNGFETTHQVRQQEYGTISAAYSYIEKTNDTAFELANTYLQVMKNNELLQTAKENVEINSEIFVKVKKLYDSGLTTLSEVNKIESSLSLAKSNLVVQENTLLDVTYNLHRLLGRYLETNKMEKPEFYTVLPNSLEDATQYAIKHNPSLLVSNYNIKQAQATKEENEASFYPKLDLEISQSVNKNLNVIEFEDSRFKAMAYLKYNIFNGFSDSADLQASVSKIHQELEIKNNLRRQVIEGLNLSWASNKKLQEQLIHLKEYKKFSLKTLTLYAKEYDLGRRSLLDLLSAQNDFIGSKSQIINTEYSILLAKYRILDAMGNLIPSIMGTEDLTYTKVDLISSTEDSLPIRLDNDNDLIVDDKDICHNSLSSEMKNIYGCSFKNDNIYKIERYNGFEFSTEDNEKLALLLKQLNTYRYKNITIELHSNLFNEDYTNEELLELSLQKAQKIKEFFIKSGFNQDSVSIIANGNTAPLFLEDNEKNNRLDIVVKKMKL